MAGLGAEDRTPIITVGSGVLLMTEQPHATMPRQSPAAVVRTLTALRRTWQREARWPSTVFCHRDAAGGSRKRSRMGFLRSFARHTSRLHAAGSVANTDGSGGPAQADPPVRVAWTRLPSKLSIAGRLRFAAGDAFGCTPRSTRGGRSSARTEARRSPFRSQHTSG